MFACGPLANSWAGYVNEPGYQTLHGGGTETAMTVFGMASYFCFKPSQFLENNIGIIKILLNMKKKLNQNITSTKNPFSNHEFFE